MSRRKYVFLIICCLCIIFITIYSKSAVQQLKINHFNHQLTLTEENIASRHQRVKHLTNCSDIENNFHARLGGSRNEFIVVENAIVADRRWSCETSVTLATQADYTFLDNLLVLVKRWRGPISVAIFTPGSDFQASMDSIGYLRNCDASGLVRKYVTFHFFYPIDHAPTNYTYNDNYNCNLSPPYAKSSPTYRQTKGLLYPINVGRNVAKQTALTHFVLNTDIELYPVVNFISRFLKMIASEIVDIEGRVFALPVFEVEKDEKVPDNKTELQDLWQRGKAIKFHQDLCKNCHSIPYFNEWMELPEDGYLQPFISVKRKGEFSNWEAFYVGTKNEPLFDERLTWEGQKDKMTQGYAMCLLDYSYVVLDDAFFVHKPGIKKTKTNIKTQIDKTKALIQTVIKPELDKLYGKRDGCDESIMKSYKTLQ